jgi:hypothetical protein
MELSPGFNFAPFISASSMVYARAWRIVAHAASDRAKARETGGDRSVASRCQSMIWGRMRLSLPILPQKPRNSNAPANLHINIR